MNAEFNWWLLIVGLVIGAGLVWLILADGSRREADLAARERASEARWIADELRRAGHRIDDDDVADVLDLHAVYLSAPPPDEPEDDVEPVVARPQTSAAPSIGWQSVEGAAPGPTATGIRTTDELTSEGRTSEGRTAEGRTAEGRTAEERPADGPVTDWSTAGRGQTERPRSDGRDQPSPSRTG